MILDGHTHIWTRWPYEPPVPDPGSRAAAAQLLWQMDRAGVERAVVIAASIGTNPENAADAFAAAATAGGRLEVFPDLECRWSPHYHSPGAAGRLEAALRRWPAMRGFTLYLAEDDPADWLTGPEGLAFFRLAEAAGLILSLSALPAQLGPVAALAGQVPRMPILLHHLAFLGPRTEATPGGAQAVLHAASLPNIHVKLSGWGNVAGPGDEYPWPRLAWIGQLLVQGFGPGRLVWGSDFPVSVRHMTYRQCLSMLTRHVPLPQDTHSAVLGGTLAGLLAAARPSG
ncbi:MAG: amidohydrolase family protein [Rhodobacteraceae bacterium]|jgi:predicted TIM-barrel fold metal-dependent hydrolase|nr:amidohydrolase family protein [Paracoccaceae bacterium]